ncbi:MAG: RHS repeat-associated core domain-containing protein, partial [Sediminibacterium sp.]|nr:RHS repeat-associated core domain-containing protein [Sediminibacterium sp.]
NPASLPSTYLNNNGNPPYNTNPSSNTTATSLKMYRLNGATGDKTGLGITLRVMAGDNVSIYGKSYWTGSSPNNSYTTVVNDLLTALAATSAVANAGKGATAAALTGSGVTPSDVSNFLSTAPLVSGRPKAYINWILFDEQFRAVSSSSGFNAVDNSSGTLKTHTQSVSIAKNGYLYVYCSNESNIDVFFDNLQVIQNRGPLLSEDHYSAFGLTMAGISSKAAGKLENKYKFNKGSEFQHQEFSDGSGLEWYDTHFRNLDPQLGRWWQVDPKPNESESPYASMGNNPILRNDPLGDTSIINQAFNSLRQGWNDFNNGKGTAYKTLDWLNRNLNPIPRF